MLRYLLREHRSTKSFIVSYLEYLERMKEDYMLTEVAFGVMAIC